MTVSLDARTPVYTVNHSDDPQRYVFDIPLQPPRSAEKVTLARQDSSNNGAPLLNICEVQLWGEQSFKSTIENFHFKTHIFFQLL